MGTRRETDTVELLPRSKVQRVMTQPIHLIFRYLQKKTRVQVWLHENADLKIEGEILGFDEYMNLVLDNAEEVTNDGRTAVGRIMLKGDNITMLRNAASA